MRKLLPYIIGILIVIALLASLPFLLNVDRYRPAMAQYLSDHLHHKVVIGKLDSSLFPPTLLMHDVNVLNTTGDQPVIQMENVSVALDLGSLVSLKVRPESIQSTGWSVTLRRAEDGSWGLGDWLPAAADLPHQAGWTLQGVALHRGEVHVIDSVNPEPEGVLHGVELTWKPVTGDLSSNGSAMLGSANFSYTFKGKGHFAATPADYTGSFQLTNGSNQGTLEIIARGDHFEAHAQSAEWKWDDLSPLLHFYTRWPATKTTSSAVTLQQWDAQFTSDGSSATFKHTGAVAGGPTEITGSLRTLPTGRVAEFDAAFKGIQVKDAENALWGTSHWEGSATGLGHFQVFLSSHPWANLTARDAYIEITDGKYHIPDTLEKTLSKAHTLKYFQQKFPDFLTQGLPFKKVAAHWQAQNGLISVDNGFLNLGDVQAGVVGKVDALKNGLDVYVRMQIHETNPRLVKLIAPSYLYTVGNRTQIQPLYGHVQGTWDAWSLRATRASKIPSALASKLKHAVAGK